MGSGSPRCRRFIGVLLAISRSMVSPASQRLTFIAASTRSWRTQKAKISGYRGGHEGRTSSTGWPRSAVLHTDVVLVGEEVGHAVVYGRFADDRAGGITPCERALAQCSVVDDAGSAGGRRLPRRRGRGAARAVPCPRWICRPATAPVGLAAGRAVVAGAANRARAACAAARRRSAACLAACARSAPRRAEPRRRAARAASPGEAHPRCARPRSVTVPRRAKGVRDCAGPRAHPAHVGVLNVAATRGVAVPAHTATSPCRRKGRARKP